MELIANGTLWYYQSYDHKAAIEEMQKLYPTYHVYKNSPVPDEFKRSNVIWRIGKLRTMTFDPDGMIEKMYVGRSYKFTKKFFPEEIGTVLIKPILNYNNDKYGLIKAGLAVDENLIKK
jgi:hypothetical protein